MNLRGFSSKSTKILLSWYRKDDWIRKTCMDQMKTAIASTGLDLSQIKVSNINKIAYWLKCMVMLNDN